MAYPEKLWRQTSRGGDCSTLLKRLLVRARNLIGESKCHTNTISAILLRILLLSIRRKVERRHAHRAHQRSETGNSSTMTRVTRLRNPRRRRVSSGWPSPLVPLGVAQLDSLPLTAQQVQPPYLYPRCRPEGSPD
jgi:hypothetical protein